MDGLIDIGHGVHVTVVGWHPDRDLNPQYADIPDADRYYLLIKHPRPDGNGECRSAATFDTEVARRLDPHLPKWTVESWEPLTLSPSILCKACGHHGFIREGHWVPA